MITFKGRWPEKEKMELMAWAVMAHLYPDWEKRNVEIECILKRHVEEPGTNVGGYCSWSEDFEDVITVEVSRTWVSEWKKDKPVYEKYPVSDIATYLAHELVHAKQLILGQLSICGQYWYGVKETGPYRKTPSEMEAFGLEKMLFETFYGRDFNPASYSTSGPASHRSEK